jgi:hypothetical protein
MSRGTSPLQANHGNNSNKPTHTGLNVSDLSGTSVLPFHFVISLSTLELHLTSASVYLENMRGPAR